LDLRSVVDARQGCTARARRFLANLRLLASCTVAKTACRLATTAAPSPIVAPTRLTDPERTSPMANTPGMFGPRGGDDFRPCRYFDVVRRLDAVDEILGHALFETWPAHQHPDLRGEVAQEDSGLTRRVATADDDYLFPPSQAGLDR